MPISRWFPHGLSFSASPTLLHFLAISRQTFSHVISSFFRGNGQPPIPSHQAAAAVSPIQKKARYVPTGGPRHFHSPTHCCGVSAGFFWANFHRRQGMDRACVASSAQRIPSRSVNFLSPSLSLSWPPLTPPLQPYDAKQSPPCQAASFALVGSPSRVRLLDAGLEA